MPIKNDKEQRKIKAGKENKETHIIPPPQHRLENIQFLQSHILRIPLRRRILLIGNTKTINVHTLGQLVC